MPRSFQRLRALIYRDMVQTLRDKRTLLLIMLLPIIQLFMFGYAVRLTVDHLPTAVVDQSMDSRSRDFISAMEQSGYFDIKMRLTSDQEVVRAIDAGQVKAGIIIHPNLADTVQRGQGQVLILLDGSDSFSVSSGYSAAGAIAQKYNFQLTSQVLPTHNLQAPVTTASRVLYNPDMRDLIFILPALIALIMQNVIVSQSTVSIVREREAGTLEQILATPARPLERILGKMVSGVILLMVDTVIVLLLGIFWFDVPFRGDAVLFGVLSFVFILASMGLGLFFSSIAQNQRQAQQFAGVLNIFSMLLTGFLYPRSSMPVFVQWISNLIPLTYFIRIVRGIFTKGVGIEYLWGDVIALVVYAVLAVLLAGLVTRPRLD